jgi:DNA polymerase-3 subunit gamma/tau
MPKASPTPQPSPVRHVALYRKYRPQRFSDVVGQDHVVKVLSAAIEKNEIAHAYLFCGSRGIGKTSIARIFAREIGTEDHDIHEIDAASHTSVEDIRALNDAVVVLPFSSKYKVYILDEVHMLSKSAFNALLKTLEEPPAHVVFILATTEMHKIPDTIISRCQSYEFAKPSARILSEVVLRVAKAEGIGIERASAELVALLGDGSFRDTLGLLQKVATYSKDSDISHAEVEAVAGAPKGELVDEYVRALAAKDASAALSAIDRALAGTGDAKVFLKLALERLRHIALSRFSKSYLESLKERVAEREYEFVRVLATDIAGATVTSATLTRLIEAYDAIDRAYIPSLPIELATVDCCA